MQRLYYLTASLDHAEALSRAIHQAGMADWSFQTIHKDEAGLYRRQVHSASLFPKRAVMRRIERGAWLGLAFAVPVMGYALWAAPLGPATSGFWSVAACGFIVLAGAGLGGLTGLAVENQAIAAQQAAIDAGQCLVCVEVNAGQAEAVKALISAQHPEARPAGNEPA
jgi:hypothetical protein